MRVVITRKGLAWRRWEFYCYWGIDSENPRCCRDEWTAEPLHYSFTKRNAWEELSTRCLRREILHRFKCTNMRLEGVLSEIRAAVPKGKSVVTGERMCHLAYIDQILKAHLVKGFKDPRKDLSAQEMLDIGAPMEHRAPPKRSLTFSGWLQHHLLPLYLGREGLRTSNAISQRREELVQRWNAFTEAQREAQLQSLNY